MDYCSSCRRHLNGALVCPGCGAYASDIAPPMSMAPAASRLDDTWPDEDLPVHEPALQEEAVPVAPSGRAARRRQRARWKKNQRKAVVATAVALVGGGLTLASMDRQSGDRAQAATAPDNEAMGATEEQTTEPDPEASTPPTARRTRPTATPTAQPTATNAPREQAAATTPTRAQAHTPKTPAPTATSAAQSQSLPGGTDTDPEPTATPTPPATEDTATPSAPPSPSATSPAGLCVLVLCLN